MKNLTITDNTGKIVGYIEAVNGKTVDGKNIERETNGIRVSDATRKNFIILTDSGIRVQTSGGAMIGLWGNTIHVEGRIEKS